MAAESHIQNLSSKAILNYLGWPVTPPPARSDRRVPRECNRHRPSPWFRLAPDVLSVVWRQLPVGGVCHADLRSGDSQLTGEDQLAPRFRFREAGCAVHARQALASLWLAANRHDGAPSSTDRPRRP